MPQSKIRDPQEDQFFNSLVRGFRLPTPHKIPKDKLKTPGSSVRGRKSGSKGKSAGRMRSRKRKSTAANLPFGFIHD